MATKISLNEGTQRALEINNIVYPIAQRTGEIEQRLIAEHDAVRDELTEYERYKVIISLLLGEKAFTELFPAGKAESLDKMAQVAYYAQKEFNADITALEKQKLEEEFSATGLNEITGKLNNFNKQIDSTLTKVDWAKKQASRKGRK